jgi:hypothetical protein
MCACSTVSSLVATSAAMKTRDIPVRPVVDATPVAGAAPAGVSIFSRGVGVDGAGSAGAELDKSFYLQKS